MTAEWLAFDALANIGWLLVFMNIFLYLFFIFIKFATLSYSIHCKYMYCHRVARGMNKPTTKLIEKRAPIIYVIHTIDKWCKSDLHVVFFFAFGWANSKFSRNKKEINNQLVSILHVVFQLIDTKMEGE